MVPPRNAVVAHFWSRGIRRHRHRHLPVAGDNRGHRGHIRVTGAISTDPEADGIRPVAVDERTCALDLVACSRPDPIVRARRQAELLHVSMGLSYAAPARTTKRATRQRGAFRCILEFDVNGADGQPSPIDRRASHEYCIDAELLRCGAEPGRSLWEPHGRRTRRLSRHNVRGHGAKADRIPNPHGDQIFSRRIQLARPNGIRGRRHGGPNRRRRQPRHTPIEGVLILDNGRTTGDRSRIVLVTGRVADVNRKGRVGLSTNRSRPEIATRHRRRNRPRNHTVGQDLPGPDLIDAPD